MGNKHNLQTILLLIFFCVLSSMASAQVTIGSDLKSNPASLFDLKETDAPGDAANSKRGLGLPRLKLTDKKNLYPMFEITPGSHSPTPDYSGANKGIQDKEHIGLIVYNLNRCNGFGQGTYVWGGTQWEPLPDIGDSIAAPSISIVNSEYQVLDGGNTLLVHFPSGRDLRAFPSDSMFSIKLDWLSPDLGNMERVRVTTELGTSGGANGGLKFLDGTDPTTWISPVTTSPIVFNFKMGTMRDIIATDNANIYNPFRSRETSVTFQMPGNECYAAGNEIKVRLNQTNYRLTIRRDNAYFNNHSYRFRNQTTRFTGGVNYYRFLLVTPYSGSNPTNFLHESNALWYANYEELFTGILASDVVGTGSGSIPAKGGAERIDGTFISKYYTPRYISQADASNKRKTAGVLTFVDTAAVNRFYPIELHFVQCMADNYDQSKIGDGDVLAESSWGEKVLKHTDQSGNPFLSAYFGSAGRWMITNLAATEYDDGAENGLAGTSVEVYQTINLRDQDGGKRKYAYPLLNKETEPENGNWGQKPVGWRWEDGVFYNWYAATGRPYDDGYQVAEGKVPGTWVEPQIVQGICPKGWYLPSDTEWLQLEQEVYNNINKYTTYDAEDVNMWVANIQTTPWDWDLTQGSDARGGPIMDHHIGHGAAMKDICPPKSLNADGTPGTAFANMQGSKGYSKEYNEGGFNATLVGRIKASKDNGTDDEQLMKQYSRAYNVDYWTRSQSANTTGFLRDFNVSYGGIAKTSYLKTHLLSVRCKKR